MLFQIGMFLKRLGYRLELWARSLEQRLPLLCDCGHWAAEERVRTETTTWGRCVTYCSECHRRIFPERY